MRAIYRIARLELSNLFYSPVAWLLLVLFVFMTGMGIADMVDMLDAKMFSLNQSILETRRAQEDELEPKE